MRQKCFRDPPGPLLEPPPPQHRSLVDVIAQTVHKVTAEGEPPPKSRAWGGGQGSRPSFSPWQLSAEKWGRSPSGWSSPLGEKCGLGTVSAEAPPSLHL